MGDNNNNRNNGNYAGDDGYLDDDGYDNYEVTTIDPSPWALVVSISISVLLIFFIPFCIALRERVRKRQGKQYVKEEDQKTVTTDQQKQDEDGEESTIDYQSMDHQDPALQAPATPDRKTATTTTLATTNMSHIEEHQPIDLLDIDFDWDELEDTADPYGLVDEDDAEDDVFENEFSWMAGSARRRNKQAVQTSAGVAIQMFGLVHFVTTARTQAQQEEEEGEKSDFSLVHYGLDAGEEAFSFKDEVLIAGSSSTTYQEDSIELQRQVVTETRVQMEADYVEMTDHSNLKIEGSPSRNTVPIGTAPQEEVHAEPNHVKKIDVNLWTGRRPWYFYFCSGGFWHKVAKCASFDKEMKGLFKLAIPFTSYSILSNILDLMEVAVIGHLIGTEDLTAYYLVGFVISISTMWVDGIWSAVYTACGHAVGAEQYKLAGQYVQMVTILYQVWFLPFCVFWWFYFEDFVLWLGFDEEVKDIAATYAIVAFVHTIVSPYDSALHYLLEVTGREVYSSVIGVLGSAASFGAVLGCAMTWDITLLHIGYIHLALEGIFLAIDLVVVLNAGWLKGGFWRGMLGTFSFCNFRAVKNIFRLSIPLNLGYLMAYGEWQALFFFAGMMGPAEIAVWGLMGSVWSAIEGISLSTTYAAEIRVAKHLGGSKPKRARYCAHKSLFLGVIISVLVSVPLLVFQDRLAPLFTTDETLQRMFNELVPYVCFGNVTMAFGSMCWTLLGAQGRYGLATFSGFVGSWGITIPLSALSTVVLGYDLQGIMASMIIGYSVSGALNSYFLLRSNWTKLSRKIVKKSGALDDADGVVMDDEEEDDEEDGFDSRAWDELPSHAKAAAMSVGIDQMKWDSGERPTLGSRAWDSLSGTEKSAIEMLGYGQTEKPPEDDTKQPEPVPLVGEGGAVQEEPEEEANPNNVSLLSTDSSASTAQAKIDRLLDEQTPDNQEEANFNGISFESSASHQSRISEIQQEIAVLQRERQENAQVPPSAAPQEGDTRISEIQQEISNLQREREENEQTLPSVAPQEGATPALAPEVQNPFVPAAMQEAAPEPQNPFGAAAPQESAAPANIVDLLSFEPINPVQQEASTTLARQEAVAMSTQMEASVAQQENVTTPVLQEAVVPAPQQQVASAFVPTPVQREVGPVPQQEVVAAAVVPAPVQQEVAPVPQQEAVAAAVVPASVQQEVVPVPQQEVVPAPVQQEVVPLPVPQQEVVAAAVVPAPVQQEVAPVPQQEAVTAAVPTPPQQEAVVAPTQEPAKEEADKVVFPDGW